MTELSPKAQAVLDTYNSEWAWRCWIEDGIPGPQFKAIAAALEAAADQVVPENPCGDDCCITQCEQIRAKLLSIAAELRDNTTPTETP